METQDRDKLLCKLLLSQLQSLGLFREKQVVLADLRERAGIRAVYHRWLQESITLLERYQYLHCHGNTCTIVDPTPVDSATTWQLWYEQKELWSHAYGAGSQVTKAVIELLERMLPALPAVLTGKRRAAEIIFPNSSMELIEGIYKHNPIYDYFNEVLATLVMAYLQERLADDKHVRLRILEIGAGTGATTNRVLQMLQPYQASIEEYCYSDISSAFLRYGQQMYAAGNPFLTYQFLNVEKPLAEQRIQLGSYDLVIASNVLHATSNIRRTVRNTKAALQKHGLLLLNEMTATSVLLHLTVGLLEGWWAYEDEELRIPGCPGLTAENWQAVLSTEGFADTYFPTRDLEHTGLQVIVAQSDGIVQQEIKQDVIVRKTSECSLWSGVGGMESALGTTSTSSTDDMTDQMVKDHIQGILIEQLSESLAIERMIIDVELAFADFGVDSLTGVNLIQRINQALSIELEMTRLFDYSSVNQLTAYIFSQYKEAIARTLYQVTSNGTNLGLPSCSSQPRIDIPQGLREVQSLPVADGHAHNSIQKDPIAIIGMSGQFAKSKTVEQLWEHLSKGSDLIEEVFRWNLAEYFTNEEYCNYGSFLDAIDLFDPQFFHISGLEATYMDPQQRLFLEESWKALEDAGYAGKSIAGRLCGIYAGCNVGDYQQLCGSSSPAQAMWGNAASILPARIAYHLNLQGPAITVDTACSSSLVALHLACQGLWVRETELALAGGVFIQTTPGFYLATHRAGMLSPTGRCYTFDQRADGFVPGEGVGVVVLKRLREALADGDHIYGVIVGSGINQDGTTNGITAPSVNSQERLEHTVYETFRIEPSQIQMMEAHGTGTKLGDPIEYEALTRAFRNYTEKKEYCALGSIKTNLGHTSTAAGVAGVIKILLSLQHKQIPPSLHFQSGNAHIQFKESPFYVNTRLKDWEVDPGMRRHAAISAFGFSGTNAHMVIEEAPESSHKHAEKPGYLIVLSARTSDQLRQQVVQLVAFCERNTELDCGNISYTLLLGRRHFNHRLACVVSDQHEMVSLLKKWLENGRMTQVFVSGLAENDQRELLALKRLGNQCIHHCKTAQTAKEYLEYLQSIAGLYVQGHELEMEDLFLDDQYSRISLPTYPFARERYWVDEIDARSGRPVEQAHCERKAQDLYSEASAGKMPVGATPVESVAGPNREDEQAQEDKNRTGLVPVRSQPLRFPTDRLCEILSHMVSDLLKIQIEQIDTKTEFSEYGFDSITFARFANQLNQTYQLDLTPSLFFEHSTIEHLAQHLQATYSAVLFPHLAGTTPVAPGPAQETSALKQGGTTIDLWSEARLDPTIVSPGASPASTTPPRTILLTGATGFLGAFLLYELLQHTSANIYCLVRSSGKRRVKSRAGTSPASTSEAFQKLETHLRTFGLWDEGKRSRIYPVVGDLAQPRLGLSQQDFHQLAEQIDTIYHAGAWVNFTYPYSVLKTANVFGTQEILRLASLVTLKPVHFISTAAVFNSPGYDPTHIILEDDPLNHCEELCIGYIESKWVAEKLVMEARSRGIPVSIYRPANVTGHSQTGVFNTSDFTLRLLKACIELKQAPGMQHPMYIAPVDYVSKAIVLLSQQPQLLGKAFNLIPSQQTDWQTLLDITRSLGYPLQTVSSADWYASLQNLVQDSQETNLTPFLSLLQQQSMTPPPMLDCSNTLMGLQNTSLAFPPIDRELFEIYFDAFCRSGFLSVPTKEATL